MTWEVHDLGSDERITRNGLYRVSIERYHGGSLCDGPSISSSGLRTIFNRSPAHFRAERAKPSTATHFAVGNLVHNRALGEGEFSKRFAVRPEKWDSWKTADSRQWRDYQQSRGRAVITEDDMRMADAMIAALAENPAVQAGILNGWIETTIARKDEATGVWVLARPDVIPTDSGVVSDLKSTTSVAFDDLERSISDFRYDAQAAVTRRNMREVMSLDMTEFFLVWCEKADPHCTQVSSIPMGMIELAEEDMDLALQMYARCLETDTWPGPGGSQTDGVPIGLTAYALRAAEARRNFLKMELSQ